MISSRMAALALIVPCLSGLRAEENVPVDGTQTKFPTAIENKVGDKEVKLILTGAALRKRAFFSVYAIGSYVEKGSSVRTPEALAAHDGPKQLHLVMERDVDGKDMAEAFTSALRRNYPEPKYAGELARLVECMRSQPLKKGDHVWLTHIPKVGFHCQLPGKTELLIKDVPFSQAIWEIYFGQNNIGEAIKKNLCSRLKGEDDKK